MPLRLTCFLCTALLRADGDESEMLFEHLCSIAILYVLFGVVLEVWRLPSLNKYADGIGCGYGDWKQPFFFLVVSAVFPNDFPYMAQKGRVLHFVASLRVTAPT